MMRFLLLCGNVLLLISVIDVVVVYDVLHVQEFSRSLAGFQELGCYTDAASRIFGTMTTSDEMTTTVSLKFVKKKSCQPGVVVLGLVYTRYLV